jgi:hypothetical protein
MKLQEDYLILASLWGTQSPPRTRWGWGWKKVSPDVKWGMGMGMRWHSPVGSRPVATGHSGARAPV